MRLRPSRLSSARVPGAPVAGVALVALFAAALLGALSPARGLRLQISQNGVGGRLPDGDAIFVSVLADGSVLVDGEPVALASLEASVDRDPSGKPIVVGTTADSPYGAVVGVLDALAAVPPGEDGVSRVLLPTHAEIADQAKLLGRDLFVPPADVR